MEQILNRDCDETGIGHRLTKVNYPWTKGQVERINCTIKETTVKRYHCDSQEQLQIHLGDFIAAHNHVRRSKTGSSNLKPPPDDDRHQLSGISPTRHSNTSSKSGQNSQKDSPSIQPITCWDSTPSVQHLTDATRRERCLDYKNYADDLPIREPFVGWQTLALSDFQTILSPGCSQIGH